MNIRLQAAVATALATGLCASVSAHENDEEMIEELVTYGRAQENIGNSQSASQGIVGFDDITLNPTLRVGELVEAVPGMVATQHSGTGKANQYFLRGFNLDHGTDFSATADGVPINMRTHGHGQGYLDLNFLIPDTVATTEYRKGPYSAAVGDFSSAGSVDFSFYERLPESLAGLTVGEFGYFNALAGTSVDVGDGVLTGVIDLTRYEGPWEIDEDLTQDKLFLSYAFNVGDARGRVTFQGYDGEWNSTDQIPLRAVQSGLIDSLGFIDPDLGGQTERYALNGNLDFGSWHAGAYFIDYDFTLFSNFNYFLNDPVNGDEFEQRDARRIYGGHIGGALTRSLGSTAVEYRWGAELRHDDISEVGLFGTTARVRNGTVRQDTVDETSLGVHGEAEFLITPKLRAIAGLRADYFDWDVNALRDVNSGSGDDTIVTPKFNLAYRFTDNVEGYVNWGRGFHSNDVRGTTISIDPESGDAVDPVEALVASEGAELGVRFEQGRDFNASLVAFWLELDSELVFVGDAGGTEANDGSRRFGFEASTFWQATDWLALNAAYTVTDAEFDVPGNATEIPGAVESTFSLGLNGAWENGLSASLRVRYLGEAPLIEDGSVTAPDSLLVNAGVVYRRGSIEWRLDAFNLFDSDDNDITYFYESRLAGEPAAGVEDQHFHPLEPRQFRLSVTKHWGGAGT
ncbi:MAG: TonB-dependent receptor [Pseudomonadota bacterium]